MEAKTLKGLLAVVGVLGALAIGCADPAPRKDRSRSGEKASNPGATPSQGEGESPAAPPAETPGGPVRDSAESTPADGAEIISGRVVGVSDGDTITVLDASRSRWKIRLATIDSPEKNQDFGSRAKESLSDMVFGKDVEVEVRSTDRYGRVVGVVRIGGTDVNLEQIKRGLAWHYTQYSKEQPFGERRTYAEAQKRAQAARTGLWVRGDAVEPWAFRRGKRKSSSDSAD
jgi:endonuclease YncB( thermonuclease family)